MKIYTTQCRACKRREMIDFANGDTKLAARARLEETCTAMPKLCHFSYPKMPDPIPKLSTLDKIGRRV